MFLEAIRSIVSSSETRRKKPRHRRAASAIDDAPRSLPTHLLEALRVLSRKKAMETCVIGTRMSEGTAAKIAETTMQTIPKNATHWTADGMASRFSVSSNTIYRLRRAHNSSFTLPWPVVGLALGHAGYCECVRTWKLRTTRSKGMTISLLAMGAMSSALSLPIRYLHRRFARSHGVTPST
jgi:AraC-like DNA-binding protein